MTSRTHHILLLNGPNLNLLGSREPEIYGYDTLLDIETACQQRAEALGMRLECLQSNHEGVLLDAIHRARAEHDGIIINPGAFGHSSIALLDALLAVDKPVIEVHLSNLHRRESFRHHSYVARAAEAVIMGLGLQGYLLALDALHDRLAS